MNLKDKVVIVTGASKGIGKAICKALSIEGAKIAAVSRSKESIESLEKYLIEINNDYLIVEADLENREHIRKIPEIVIKKYGKIDILINNAGIIHESKDLVDFDFDVWDQVFSVNITAPAYLIKFVLPYMINRKSGKIINISSIGGRKGGKGRSAYRASKAALINLTESVASEVKTFGIDVNCICPSATDTEGYRKNIDPNGRDFNTKVMTPEKIADIVVFLASDLSLAITGTAIDAFGGTNPIFS